jgi:hypothetical protein
MNDDLVRSKSLAPHTLWELYLRKLRLLRFLCFPGSFGAYLKLQINLVYRRFLSKQYQVDLVDVHHLLDWNALDLRLSRPTTNDGQVSPLELLCIVGLAKHHLQSGQNFLEIGTFDGSTALNVALNLPEASMVITIDLPEDTKATSPLSYDNYLIRSEARSKKRHLHVTERGADLSRLNNCGF